MTIGVGTFTPNGRFSVPRSFINDIVVYHNGDTIVQVANSFTIHAPFPDPTIGFFRLDNRFWGWSSNYWTLDYIITDCWYKLGGVGAEIPMPFQLHYYNEPTTGRTGLSFGWFSAESDPHPHPLPSAPLNYWLPKPMR
jgi:hypothetical protein